MINRITLLLLFIGLAWGQVDIDGFSYLDNESNHSDIMVIFERIAPSSLYDTTYTTSDGYYFIQLENGIYDISFSITDYYSRFLRGQSLYNSTTFDDITLFTNIIFVPEDYSTIQEALNVVNSNDTVLVDSGTYAENILWHFTKTGIKLIGSGENNCIIDGSSSGSVIDMFEIAEYPIDSTTLIQGFTLQNGYSQKGGGLKLHAANPTISNMIISGNIATQSGGGIELDESSPILSNVIIKGNSCIYDAGGINCTNNSNAVLDIVIIIDNTSDAYGGGMSIKASSNIYLNNVTISGNTATERGGGIYIHNSSPLIKNTTISGNIVTDNESTGGGIYFNGSQETDTTTLLNTIVSYNTGDFGLFKGNSGVFEIHYSDLFENDSSNCFNCGEWVGANVTTNVNGDSCDAYFNINLNPQYCIYDNSDFTLSDNSPCIGAGEDGTNIGASWDECSFIMGDVNNDGQLDITDALYVIIYIMENSIIDYEELGIADMDYNYTIDLYDVLYIIDQFSN